jgi:hypothetical protein
LYGYVGNDCVNHTDNLGLKKACCKDRGGKQVEYDADSSCCESDNVVAKIGMGSHKCCPEEFKKQELEKLAEIETMGYSWKDIPKKIREYLDGKYPCVSMDQGFQDVSDCQLRAEKVLADCIGEAIGGAANKTLGICIFVWDQIVNNCIDED